VSSHPHDPNAVHERVAFGRETPQPKREAQEPQGRHSGSTLARSGHITIAFGRTGTGGETVTPQKALGRAVRPHIKSPQEPSRED
jgi:hypothetical protein